MTASPTRSILTMDRPALEEYLSSIGEPRYRAKQILTHLYQHFTPTLDGMTDLPRKLRDRIGQDLAFPEMKVDGAQHDPSGPTDKLLITLDDGARIEAVVMHNRERAPTLCVSSQVGCPLGCLFCATGLMGFRRNLTEEEMAGQFWLLLSSLHRQGVTVRPTVVFMGMGEPLLNRRVLFATLSFLTDPERLGFADRRITVSTVGVPEGIRALADLGLGVNLALSLHHPDEAERRRLMPFTKAPLAEVMDALTEYAEKTGRLVTFEYVMLGGVNDAPEHADGLVHHIRAFGHPALVNLIPYNPVQDAPFGRSKRATIDAFVDRLRGAGVRTTVRRTQGGSISAACGQLALTGFPTQRPLPVVAAR